MRCRVSYVKYFLVDFLGSHYLFEILQISVTLKNSENVVKSRCLKKTLQ